MAFRRVFKIFGKKLEKYELNLKISEFAEKKQIFETFSEIFLLNF